MTSSESSSVSEDEGVIPLETRAQFSATLDKIQSRDASIYDPEAEFFETASSSSEERLPDDAEQPLYLKDVRAQHLVAYGAQAYSSDESLEEIDEEEEAPLSVRERQQRLSYNEEQTQNRGELLKALARSNETDEGDDFGGLKKAEQGSDTELPDPEVQATKEAAQKNLDSYFAHLSDLKAEDAAFLKEYIEKEEWRVDKWGMDEEMDDEIDLEQDEAYLEQGAQFEADYNYRFEEPGSHQVVGHPRMTEGTLRKKESKRKRQRANKAERKRQERLKEETEIKEEKNLKRKEIQQKSDLLPDMTSDSESVSRMAELAEVCGEDVNEDLLHQLLDSDHEFNVQEWDAKMEETFNEDYYQRDDAEYQIPPSEAAASSQVASKKYDREDVDKTALEVSADHKAELERLMKQYYELDREETIEGMKCRYRYIKVPKESYGLETHDILSLDDRQLNGYVGLRRLNPYRDDLNQYKANPWRLKQLLTDIDYTHPASSQPKRHEEQSSADRMVLDQAQEDEAYLAEKIEEEANEKVKARLESYSHATLKPYQHRKQNHSKESTRKLKVASTEQESEFKGMKKSQKKNMKRRRKQEMRNNTA